MRGVVSVLGAGRASVNTRHLAVDGFRPSGFPDLAKRKPMLLLRLPGSLLLRLADRQLLSLLFQLPPRLTRLEPFITHSPIIRRNF